MTNSSVLADKTQSIESSMHHEILAFYYAFALAYWYGAWLIKEDNLSYEKLTVSVFVEFFSCFGITVASAVAPDLSSGADATHLVASKIDQVPVIDSYGITGRVITGMKGELTFDNLSFSYANREALVLRNLNFTARQEHRHLRKHRVREVHDCLNDSALLLPSSRSSPDR
jgi:ABC-type multidrug transport system fused ATPase/permease subunit